MKVFIVTLGTRGDFELFFMLARELRRRGHDVTLAASAFHAERVEGSDLTFVPIGRRSLDDARRIVRGAGELADPAARTRHFYREYLKPELPDALPTITSIAGPSDYFISNLKLLLGKNEQIIPGAFVTYDPPGSIDDLTRYSRGVPDERLLEIVAFPRALIDPDHVWPERFHFTGFFYPQASTVCLPSAELDPFLDSGTPPVVLTLGSMTMHDAPRLIRIFDEALDRLDLRGVVVGGWSDLATATASERVYLAPEIPYDELFPRCSAVIHHGGVGTVAAVLHAGKPSVLLPQVQCQFQVAEMLTRENLCAATLDARSLSSDELARAIARASEPAMRESAARWGERVRSDPGLAGAADLIEGHFRRLH